MYRCRALLHGLGPVSRNTAPHCRRTTLSKGSLLSIPSHKSAQCGASRTMAHISSEGVGSKGVYWAVGGTVMFITTATFVQKMGLVTWGRQPKNVKVDLTPAAPPPSAPEEDAPAEPAASSEAAPSAQAPPEEAPPAEEAPAPAEEQAPAAEPTAEAEAPTEEAPASVAEPAAPAEEAAAAPAAPAEESGEDTGSSDEPEQTEE
ncbi:uncharacterized protein [Diadema antillarum]|uniref:uncharacterized protein n=1 Tax=Diadema antillarum TaxID=105358 RepID=UPI003A860FFB